MGTRKPYAPATTETSTAKTKFSRCQWEECCNLLAPKPPLKRGVDQQFCDVDWHRGCSVPGCRRRHRAKGLCVYHWNKQNRETSGRNEPWNDAARSRYHKRLALKQEASTGVPVRKEEIAVRDNYICGLCHEAVDMDLPYPKWGSATTDHATPLSRGGMHDPNNVLLAHLGCNLEKKQMTLEEWFAFRSVA